MRSPNIPEAAGVDDLMYEFNPQSTPPDETNSVPSHELVERDPGYVEERRTGGNKPSSSPKLVRKESHFLRRCALDTDR